MDRTEISEEKITKILELLFIRLSYMSLKPFKFPNKTVYTQKTITDPESLPVLVSFLQVRFWGHSKYNLTPIWTPTSQILRHFITF